MLHWYRLAREIAYRHSHPTDSRLIAEPPAQRTGLESHGTDLTRSLSPRQHGKLFWLGLAEAAPLVAGAVFSTYTHSKLDAAIAALVAVALSSILCWCLRHQTPLTRIEYAPPSPARNSASSEATRPA